jgi:hypothetical protein
MSKKENSEMNHGFVNKISAKQMGIDMDTIRESVKKGDSVLFTIYGQIQRLQNGNGDNGEWTKFIGMFEAVNALTGEIFRSGNMFLPPAVTPIVEGQVLAALKSEDFVGMQIAYEISAKKSELPIGYEYVTKNLLSGIVENDPLLAMRKQFVTAALPK